MRDKGKETRTPVINDWGQNRPVLESTDPRIDQKRFERTNCRDRIYMARIDQM